MTATVDHDTWLASRAAEAAKSPAHARVVKLETDLAILENSDGKCDLTYETTQRIRAELPEARRLRDAAEYLARSIANDCA